MSKEKESKAHVHSGFCTFLVPSIKELEVLLMGNKSYSVETAHRVSSQKIKTKERSISPAGPEPPTPTPDYTAKWKKL